MSIEVVTRIKIERPAPAYTFDVNMGPLWYDLPVGVRVRLELELKKLAQAAGMIPEGLQFTVHTDDELLATTLRDGIVALAAKMEAGIAFDRAVIAYDRAVIALDSIDAAAGRREKEPQPERGEATSTAAEEAQPEQAPDAMPDPCMCTACQLRRAIEADETTLSVSDFVALLRSFRGRR